MSENRINPGDANQITRDYFDSLLIEMRHLDGVKPSTKVEIFGKTFDTPIMMAAFSHMKTLEDVARAAKAIHGAFHPEKLNYGAYGDTGCHLHVHLVPKYRDGYEWGGVFAMNPGRTTLSDSEYAEMIEKIKANL